MSQRASQFATSALTWLHWAHGSWLYIFPGWEWSPEGSSIFLERKGYPPTRHLLQSIWWMCIVQSLVQTADADQSYMKSLGNQVLTLPTRPQKHTKNTVIVTDLVVEGLHLPRPLILSALEMALDQFWGTMLKGKHELILSPRFVAASVTLRYWNFQCHPPGCWCSTYTLVIKLIGNGKSTN